MKIIVTGASRGIGAGIAKVLSKHKHDVGVLARNEEQLNALVNEIKWAGGICTGAVCDLRKFESVEQSILKLKEELGGIDVLINNAGLVIRKDAMTISLDEWHDLINTNINGLFYATKVVLPILKENGSGHIINISSISGKVPLPGGSGYAASKYAVTGFSESLLQEVRDFGIKVSVVFPGSVDSESHRSSGDDGAWKVTPEEVGEACRTILETRDTNLIHQLEIRPLKRPQKK